MARWKVASSVSTYPDATLGNSSSLNTAIIQDKVGAFLCSQLGSARQGMPAFMALPSPGVDIPFENFQSPSFNTSIRAKNFSISLQNNKTSGTPLELLTSTPDDTPRFIASSGFPKENDINNFDKVRKWKWNLASQKNSFSIFPALIPATSFSTISCDLFSEIQRHMLEPTIDGGITWSPLWTKEEVQGYFNERLECFYLQTGVIQEEFSVGVTSGLSEYNYPGDLIQAKRLSFEQNLSLYDSLVSFWRLNEAGGTTRFDSIEINNLASLNGVTQESGKIDFAGGFVKSSSQVLNISNTSQVGLNPGIGDFSISTWVYPTDISATSFYGIIGKGATNNSPLAEGYWLLLYGTGLGLPAGTFAFTLGDSVQTTRIGGAPGFIPPLNTWSHIVVTFDRSGAASIWYNGVQQGFTDISGRSVTINPSASFALGASSDNGGGFNQYFSGRIDATGYWSRLLTKEEILQLYNNGNGKELYPGAHDGPYNVLPRVDPFTQDNGDPGWQLETGTPSSIIEEPRAPLSFQLAPTPDVNGSVEGIYVADPSPVGDVCVPLPIPNFLCWGIKYGVMADMLNKEGEANDPERGKYCESRYQECIQLTRALLGFNDPDEDDSQQKGGGQ